MTITVNKEKKEVRWNMQPPLGLSFQTHKFSLMDAVELASNMIGTDYTAEHEKVVCGGNARVLLTTLPYMILSSPTPEGLMPREGDLGVIGTIGPRKFYWTKETEAIDTMVVSNPREKATILLIHSQNS